MSQSVFFGRKNIYALLALGLLALPALSLGQGACPSGQVGTWPSCVTSNLHRVLLLSGGEGTDHDPATANNVAYIQALDSANGIRVDYYNVKTTSSVLSPATLAQYDVMLWFNVYLIDGFISTTQKAYIQNWFEGGKGLGCFHQCVKVEATTGTWLWYDSVMAQPYQTYAIIDVTGPVFVDSESTGIIDSSYKGQVFSWNDEWYDYLASPRKMPGVKIMLTTRDSAFAGVSNYNSNANMAKDHVLSWSHDFNGGRYYVNGLYHPTISTSKTASTKNAPPQTGMTPDEITFVNSSFLNAQKYLAGYTGCMNPSYWEYSSMATNQGANSCLSPLSGPKPVGIVVNEAFNGISIGNFKVTVSQSGRHTVELFDVHGKMLLSYHGVGAHVYTFSEIHAPGIYYVKVMTPNSKKALSRKLFLL